MRLFLSSQSLGNHTDAFVRMANRGKRIAIINNAKDGLSTLELQQDTADKVAAFSGLGFEVAVVDLKKYFHDNAELSALMRRCDVVWLCGGNTFVLRRALAYSGLDAILVHLAQKDKVLFGGSSAGAIIATPTLRGVEGGDNPSAIPEGYKSEIMWSGLDLVNIHLVPHYESDWFALESKAMEQYLIDNDMAHEVLRDGDVYIVDGDISGVLG